MSFRARVCPTQADSAGRFLDTLPREFIDGVKLTDWISLDIINTELEMQNTTSCQSHSGLTKDGIKPQTAPRTIRRSVI